LAAVETSNLRRDEHILFFPGAALHLPDEKGWEINITGCVYENEKRRAALLLLRKSLGWDRSALTEAENTTFESRAALFLLDNERGKTVVIQIGDKHHRVGKSGANGRFAGTLRLSESEVDTLLSAQPQRVIPFRAVLKKDDDRVFGGEIRLIENKGLAVISDIDDTIKVSEVGDRRALLRKTFLEPFQPVTGMADLYRSWSNHVAVHFFYVSASPWQLYGPLSDFVNSNGFPAGSYLLKDFRWKDRTFFNLFGQPGKYKVERIESVLERLPEREFVLVGDSGERDPEAYVTLAKKHPKQIRLILIRDVTDEPLGSDRYQRLLEDFPPAKFRLFKESGEIVDALPVAPAIDP
jgi:hypothetical protein